MQIPKILLVLNVAVLAVIPTAVQAVQTQSTIVLAPVPASQRAPMLLAAAPEFTAPAGNTDNEAAARLRLREAMRKALTETAPTSSLAPAPTPKSPKPGLVLTPRSPAQPAPAPIEQPAESTTRIVKPSQKWSAGPVFSDPSPFLTPSPTPGLPSNVTGAADTAVPSAIAASKEGRLAVLLRQYKGDAITAQDYHSKRAAILAEP